VIDQIGISRRYRRLAGHNMARLRPPLTASGDWWATTTCVSHERLPPLSYIQMVLCTARYPEPEKFKKLPEK